MRTDQPDSSASERPSQERPAKEPVPFPLPVRAMLTRGLVATSGIAVLAGGLALLHSVHAAMGVAMGALASFVASVVGLSIIGPTKARPPMAWHGLLFAGQAFSLFLTVTISLVLLYSATQPARVAALPTAAVVFITVWIVFAKAYGRSSHDSQSEG